MIEEVRRTTRGMMDSVHLGHIKRDNVLVHRHLVQDVGEPLRLLKDKMSKVKKIEVEFHE